LSKIKTKEKIQQNKIQNCTCTRIVCVDDSSNHYVTQQTQTNGGCQTRRESEPKVNLENEKDKDGLHCG